MSVQATHVTKPITILGAGVSGLAFAQALRTHSPNIPFVVMERDKGYYQRTQGYRVGLNGRAVDDARAVMSPSLFDRLCGSCPDRVVGQDGAQKMGTQFDAVTGEQLSTGHVWRRPDSQGTVSGEPVTSLSADRSVLRNVLIRGIEDKVQYGKEFTKYEVGDDGVVIHFGDGSMIEGSLLVAADGARSRARKQLLGDAAQLWDTDLRTTYGKTPLTEELEARLHEQILTSGTSILKDARDPEHPAALIVEPLRFKKNEYRHELPDDYVFWALAMRQPRAGLSNADVRGMSHQDAAAFSKRFTAHWHESIRPLFEMQDENNATTIRIATVKPGFPSLSDAGRVALIGDAAHAMSPSAGAGAATAIKDGEVLARMLREKDVGTAVKEYESEMRKYVENSLGNGERNGKFLFNMPAYDEMRTLEY